MYHYVADKAFTKRAQSVCVDILSDLTSKLLEHDISLQFILVGSGCKKYGNAK